jgi:3,4-dihydroxy 2-butanone 4-phosphate synthase / GTP cyclohydrolase II
MTSTIENACKALQSNKMVIIQDDADRENEGDFVCHGATCSTEMVNFMAQFGRGLICLALPAEHIDQLQLPLQPVRGTSNFHSPFTVSIDAAFDVTTGISCHERAHTIRTAARSDCQPSELLTPGHIFPLRAHPKGLQARQGHTEASLALMQLAGLSLNAVICEILNSDGAPARGPDLKIFSETHLIPFVNIEQIWHATQQVE